MNILAHLKELSAAPGVSGYEGGVRPVLRAAWKPLTSDLQIDRLGSLWALKPGTPAKGQRKSAAPRPRVLLTAHMDSIGMMVSRVEGEFLRMTRLGGVDIRVLPGQPVLVHGTRSLPGVIARPPAFLLPKAERDGSAALGELVVDLGLPAEQVRAQVKVGDVISFAQPPVELSNGLLAAPALDNRASLAALTVCLDLLRKRAHVWDVLVLATVGEEERYSGAYGAAFDLQPDLAVVVDVSFGSDANTREFPGKTFPLGGGPTLGLGPNFHPGLLPAFQAAAQRAQIPHSIEVYAGDSGTDAVAIQIARAGLPTMAIGLPLRHMHTPVEVVALADITRTGELLAEFVAGLNAKFLSTLTHD
jgi:endoglucanase